MIDVVADIERFKKLVTPSLSKEVPRQGAGTVFPTGITAGYTFFRTDLGWLCYYDGTRWLTAHEYPAVMTTTPAAATVTTPNLVTVAQRDNFAIYVTRVVLGFFVATTNNATNFWTITHQGQSGTFGTTNDISTHDTSGNGPGSWNTFDIAPTVTATPANYRHLNIAVAKTLAPGQLSILSTVYYRLVIP